MATLQPNQDQEVTISEKGELKIYEATAAAGAGPDAVLTVPTGKQWMLKGIFMVGTGGATQQRCFIRNTGGTAFLFFADATTPTLDSTEYTNNDIIMNAGWNLWFLYSGTTGSASPVRALVQEFDA